MNIIPNLRISIFLFVNPMNINIDANNVKDAVVI